MHEAATPTPRRRFAIGLIVGIAVACAAGCQIPYAGGAKPVDPATLDASWLRAAPTPVVRQQQDTDCGLAALAMVAGRWGFDWSVAELADHIPVTQAGVKLGALRDLARLRGLSAFAIAGTTQDLQHELAAGRPVLIGLVLPFDRHHARAHFEVAVAMNPKDGTLITLDPASGKWMKRPANILDGEWKLADYATLVVVGAKPATKVTADARP